MVLEVQDQHTHDLIFNMKIKIMITIIGEIQYYHEATHGINTYGSYEVNKLYKHSR